MTVDAVGYEKEGKTMTKKQKRSSRSYREKQRALSYFQWDSERKAKMKQSKQKLKEAQ